MAIVSLTLGVSLLQLNISVSLLVCTSSSFGYMTEQLSRPMTLETWSTSRAQRMIPFLLGVVQVTGAMGILISIFYEHKFENSNVFSK